MHRVIKEIWKLGYKVDSSKISKICDNDSVQYLFSMAKIEVHIDKLAKEKAKLAIDNKKITDSLQSKDDSPMLSIMHSVCQTSKNKEDRRTQQRKISNIFMSKEEMALKEGSSVEMLFDLDRKICALKHEFNRIRQTEINRLMHEHLYSNYNEKHIAPIEKLLTLLFGEDQGKKEMEKLKKRVSEPHSFNY